MSSFSVKLDELSNSTQDLYNSFQEYADDQRSFFSILDTVDCGWNDDNTTAFLDILGTDRDRNNDLLDVAFGSCNTIFSFTRDISSTLTKNGITSPKTVSYNQNNTLLSIRTLDSVIINMNTLIRKVQEDMTACDARKDIQNFMYWFTSSKNTINSVKNGMYNISTGFENSVTSAKRALSVYNAIDIKDNKLQYKWDTVSLIKDNSSVYETRNEEDVVAVQTAVSDVVMGSVTGGRDVTYATQGRVLSDNSTVGDVDAPVVLAMGAQNKNLADNGTVDEVETPRVIATGAYNRDLNENTYEGVGVQVNPNHATQNGMITNQDVVYGANREVATNATQGMVAGVEYQTMEPNKGQSGNASETFVMGEQSDGYGQKFKNGDMLIGGGMLGAAGMGNINGSMDSDDDEMSTSSKFNANNKFGNGNKNPNESQNNKANQGHLNNNSNLQNVDNVRVENFGATSGGMYIQSGLNNVSIQGVGDYTASASFNTENTMGNLDIDTTSYKRDFDGIHIDNNNN